MKVTPKEKKRAIFLGTVAFLYGSMFLMAAILYQVEKDVVGANIKSFWDAFWCLQMASSTIGYGDVTPVTMTGRVLVIMQFYIGVALVSFLGFVVSSKIFNFPDLTVRNKDIKHQNDKIIREIHILNSKLESLSDRK